MRQTREEKKSSCTLALACKDKLHIWSVKVQELRECLLLFVAVGIGHFDDSPFLVYGQQVAGRIGNYLDTLSLNCHG